MMQSEVLQLSRLEHVREQQQQGITMCATNITIINTSHAKRSLSTIESYKLSSGERCSKRPKVPIQEKEKHEAALALLSFRTPQKPRNQQHGTPQTPTIQTKESTTWSRIDPVMTPPPSSVSSSTTSSSSPLCIITDDEHSISTSIMDEEHASLSPCSSSSSSVSSSYSSKLEQDMPPPPPPPKHIRMSPPPPRAGLTSFLPTNFSRSLPVGRPLSVAPKLAGHLMRQTKPINLKLT